MDACAGYREMLILDVHGGLAERERASWEAHLKTCPACRAEHLRLSGLLGSLREAMDPPPLAPGRAAAVARSIGRDLSTRKSQSGVWGSFLPGRGLRLFPAVASLCVLVVVTLFVLRGPEKPSRIQPRSDPQGSMEIRAEDQEIITNLDLLRELDWVRKLVRVIDEGEPGSSAPSEPANTQGMRKQEERGTYA